MRNILKFVILFLISGLFLIPIAQASGDGVCSINSSAEIYFFYGEGCSHCAMIEPMVKSMCNDCGITLKTYETRHNKINRELFINFSTRYCVPKDLFGSVPAIFVGDSVLIGDAEINKNLYDKIQVALNNNIDPLKYSNEPCEVVPPPLPPDTILAVITAALIDSLNPCAIGVLIIFISFIVSSINFSKRRLALYGLIYISSVYLAYFLAGIGILRFLQNFEFIIFIQIFVVLFLILGTILTWRDAYRSLKKKGDMLLAIPKSAKGTIEKYIKKGTIPAAVILGVLVAAVELPCTGQVYAGILIILSSVDFVYGATLLLLYNFIFVLPLLIILFLALSGKNFSKIAEAKDEGSWLIRYLIGWVMIILAIVIINQILTLTYTQIPGISVLVFENFTQGNFFLFVAVSVTILFIILAVLKPIVTSKIKVWYCALCYAFALTWMFLVLLYFLGLDVPKMLLAGLIGMSLAGIWEEMKKFDFKYFGIYTLFLINFTAAIFYVLFIDDKFIFLILLTVIFAMDGVIFMKNLENREEIGKMRDKKTTGKREKRSGSLREMLDHCCD